MKPVRIHQDKLAALLASSFNKSFSKMESQMRICFRTRIFLSSGISKLVDEIVDVELIF